MKFLSLTLFAILCACSPPSRTDAGTEAGADSSRSDVLEPVAPFPTSIPFSFIRQETQADLAAYGIRTATVSPIPVTNFTVTPSEPGCIHISEQNPLTPTERIYERFVDRVDLQLGNDDVVPFDASTEIIGTYAIATDAAPPPNTPLRITAYSSRWMAPWSTQQALPPPVGLTVPTERLTHWNRYELFAVQWDAASAPQDAVIEIDWVLGAATNYRDTLRCSAPTSAGTLRVNLWEHTRWFTRITTGGIQYYEIFITRRRIERGPAGETVVVESRSLIGQSASNFHFD
jgi:hypothetical protein